MKESCCWKIKMLVSKYTVWNKHSQAANWFFQAQLSLYEPYYSSWRRMVCICFGVVVIILTLIFCLKYWYQDDHNQLKWGCIKVFQSSLQKGWDENLFFQCRNLILLINFHSRYITACFANVYSDISRLTLFCSCFFFLPNSMLFDLSSPKWMSRLTDQSQQDSTTDLKRVYFSQCIHTQKIMCTSGTMPKLQKIKKPFWFYIFLKLQ